MDGDGEVSPNDVMRVLVATDNHLGYGEKDIFRAEDSFIAFEEILEYAVVENVDFILLGGDLFHDPVPSQNAMEKCMALLRKYTWGSKPISVEFLNEENDIFHNSPNDSVNYVDPNINISIPVFSIHGNHDEPCGLNRLSSLDLLSVNGMVNYFGRWKDLSSVEIKPIYLRKGITQLALYGLSHIHDSRLTRLFETHKVVVDQPKEGKDDWFNVLVLHQNRSNRGPKNYLPEEVLPDFMHFVIWGHEHDCYIDPMPNAIRNFYVTQPGSSVATSLAEGEARKKHIGVLEIYKTLYKFKPLPLKSVRPFVFKSITISDVAEDLNLETGDTSNKVQQMAREEVESMIQEAVKMHTDHPNQPKLPLIRLRLIYSDEEQMFNTIRFGQTFNDRVANPSDIVVFKKLNRKARTGNEHVAHIEKDAMDKAFAKIQQDANARVEDLLEEYFENLNTTQPQIVPPKMMSELCYLLVKNDDTAAENLLNNYKKRALAHLMETLPNKDEIDDQLYILRDSITPDDIANMCIEDNSTGAKSTATAAKRKGQKTTANQVDTERVAAKSPPISTRGGRGGRGRGTVTRKEQKTADNQVDTEPASSSTGGGRGRRGRSTAISSAPVATARVTQTSTSLANNKPSTRGKQLDISITSKRSTRREPQKRTVYVISDSEESG